jgi:hypothetical protein
MPPFAEIVALSPWLVALWMLLIFAERVLLPFFLKHVWPQWSKRAKAERDRAAKAEQEREREARLEEEDRRRREDRLYEVVEANTRVMSNLQTTLERMGSQLGQQSDVIHALALDVAGIYGHLQVPRPSRKTRATADEGAPRS